MATTMMTCPHCGDRWRAATRSGGASRVCPDCRAVPTLGAFVEVSGAPPRRGISLVVWPLVGVLATFAVLAVGTGAFALAASYGSLATKHFLPAEIAAAPAAESTAIPVPEASEPAAPPTPVLAAEPTPALDWAAVLGPEIDALSQVNAVNSAPAPKLEPIVEATESAKADAEPTGTCGTTIDFLSNLAAATARAKKEHKLLFVLHVSGNFEESGFT